MQSDRQATTAESQQTVAGQAAVDASLHSQLSKGTHTHTRQYVSTVLSSPGSLVHTGAHTQKHTRPVSTHMPCVNTHPHTQAVCTQDKGW